MTCCFIGHRRIKHKKELASRLRDNICYLLEQGVATFLFGDHSEFNMLCYEVVSELREVYPKIRRIHYRTDYPDADAYTMQFLLDGYEDSICPDGVAAAGKAAYVERNQAMIQASDFCVFYFNNEYLPASRKESKKAITSYQPKSGTGVAFDYAKAHGRTIIMSGEELLVDQDCSVIDAILKKEEKSTLYAAVAKLSPAEINLMTSLYLCDDPIGQREYARRHGVAVTTINHQLTVALKKLKKMLPN